MYTLYIDKTPWFIWTIELLNIETGSFRVLISVGAMPFKVEIGNISRIDYNFENIQNSGLINIWNKRLNMKIELFPQIH